MSYEDEGNDLAFGAGGRRMSSLRLSEDVPAQAYQDVGLRRGIVVAVRYTGEKGGVRHATTYDVVLDYPRERRNAVPVACRARSGYQDGDENVLHPVAASVEASRTVDIDTADLSTLDGDMVLVGFIDGDTRRPVIVGVMPHPKAAQASSTYTASRSDGEVRRVFHKGTLVEIDQTGNVALTLKTGATVTLGKPATDFALKGTSYKTASDTFLTALDTYTKAIQGIADPTNVATPVLTAAITAFKLAIAAAVSDKVKVG